MAWHFLGNSGFTSDRVQKVLRSYHEHSVGNIPNGECGTHKPSHDNDSVRKQYPCSFLKESQPDTAVKDSRGFDHYSFLCRKQITVKCYVQGDFHHRSLLSQKYMISWLLGLKRQLYSTYLTPDKAVEVSLCLWEHKEPCIWDLWVDIYGTYHMVQ